MANIVNAITSGLNGLIESIGSFFGNLGTNLGDWFGDVGDWFSSLGSNLGGWFSNLFSTLGNLLSYINPFNENFLGYKIIDLLSQALTNLFVPQGASVLSLQDTVNDRFAFVDSIKLAIDDIDDMLNNVENGTSEFTLDIESDVYSGEVVLFDLSWYAPFKSYGDLVFTGFAYVLFIWRLYKNIPNIINGFGFIGNIGGGDD